MPAPANFMAEISMTAFHQICSTKKNCDAEIIPEIWLFGNESFKIAGPREEQTVADLRIISAKPQKE